ncbi:ACP S-malonyltransferase [Streptomyces solincola]|uniref:[acyl-carrier-protein] S-malonyltransferase n=1 Tax=Streptomyces solincola TaxID=2100817 RepID=A0A2S9PS33_9ACTN|nr:ACP S-malonyltransferase [Streptomyces solincola]PRH77235.1 ACP S-malonyltransferase [Streptomyces solincola]
MYAVLAPGQGSQRPGMLTPWLRDPESAALVRQWSDLADADLIHLGTRAPAAQIDRTENTQPLLVAQGLLAHQALAPAARDRALVAAGHSVGELTACVYAGVLTPEDAIRLAAVRGRAMAAACADTPTTMAAVVGGQESQVLARLRELDLVPATFNGPGQIVAAGPVQAVEELTAAPPPGAAVRGLAVAGAFHTPYMEPARRAFARAASATRFDPPRALLLSNADGDVRLCPDEIRHRLVEQLVRPVRWDLCLNRLARLAPRLTLTLPPDRTLTGLLRRHPAGLAVHPVGTPRDMAAAQRLTAAAPHPPQEGTHVRL